MITFEYPLGLALLLVIPLLLLLARRRAIPQRVIFPAFFLVEELKRPVLVKTLRFFRLKKKYRLSFVVFLLTCLALAISGTSLKYERYLPEDWLVVVDNLPLGLQEFEGRTVHDGIKEFLLQLAGRLEDEDRLGILTTSPAPRFRSFPPGKELDDYLRALSADHEFLPVEDLAGTAGDLAGLSSRAVLLSPRSGRWRQAGVGQGPGPRLVIPADRHTAQGNSGIVHARIRPHREAEGRHDLFLKVMTSDRSRERLALSAEINGRPLDVFDSLPVGEGEGRLFLEGLPLPPGALTVRLEGVDAFSIDDSVTVALAGPRTVKVSLSGDGTPVFRAALGSYENYSLVEPHEGEVAVFLGESPPVLDRPSLVIYPSIDRMGLVFQELVETTGEVSWHPDHPITAVLGAEGFRLRRVTRYSFDEDFQSVASIDGVPAILVGHRDGQPVVVWTFNPLEYELFLTPEFVILLRESLTWLADEKLAETVYLLSPRLTREAEEVAVPEMDPGLFERARKESRSTDLTPFLLLAVLLSGAYLGLVDALAEEGPE